MVATSAGVSSGSDSVVRAVMTGIPSIARVSEAHGTGGRLTADQWVHSGGWPAMSDMAHQDYLLGPMR
jgi:hypothetical protein